MSENRSMSLNEVAKVCHEVNRAYCQALGDNSKLPWDNAPEWQKSSAINGVMIHDEHPEAGPEASHETWMEEKFQNGWKYGPVKDADKKEHPCMVPFNNLPVEQKAKGYIFRAIVHCMKEVCNDSSCQ